MISNITRLINLIIIIVVWACITRILYLLVSYLKLTNTLNQILVYIIILVCVLLLNFFLNGDILVDEMFYRKLNYQSNNQNN